MIYDRTQIPSEEKLFIKTMLNEINTLQEKNHKHNTSLVLEFNNLNKKSKVFPINGLISSLKEDKSFLAATGLAPMLASKFIKQAELCGPDIKWIGCEIKSLNEGTILIGMTGIIHNHRADMVSFVSTKDVTTEVNQLLISKDGERKVRTRVVSELSNKVLMVKELTSSLGNKRVLYNRHSYLDVPTSSVTIAIITPPSFSEQPLIVPLADIRVEDEVVMEEITTGIVRKRVVTLETPVSAFENRTSSKTYVIKQDEDGNVLYGAKLSLWKDGKLVRSFTTTAVTFGAVLADGDYILREDEAPYGYEKAADISFQVKDYIAYQNGAAVSENMIVMTDKALPTLTVSKKVTGSFGDKYKDFKFYLTLDDDSITSLSYMKGDAIETVTRNADNQFEFTLSHGESVVFANLPVGTGYTVTEPDAKAEGYEVTADGATGTIQENGSTVLFTNHRNMVVPTELDTNMAVFGMILVAGCVLLIGYGLKRRKK